MSGDLLQTKLYVPQSRPFLVPRPHLIEKLNQSLRSGHKLTLVSAPAGFGKTTLVSTWLQQTEQPIAWLSLDVGDNDLSRFLTYVVAALQTIEDKIGQGILTALQSPETVNAEVILTALLNDISELLDDVVLILDDYHIIESQSIDKAITFLLEHLPARMHLVIVSRIDPSLPLSRLRASGELIEIRAHGLRFTLDETAVFLNQSFRFNLSAQAITAMGMRTEGWIAGLQLAALALQGVEQAGDIADFIDRFTGNDRYIQDYLADEVLAQRPQGTRDFLLQTSILRRLNGSLCDAVCNDFIVSSGRSEESNEPDYKTSQSLLENLDAANLFIVSLDNEREWYRYHHLFADLLRHRLNHTFPERIPDLHRSASAWYEQAGFIDDAIYHAQAACDNERFVEIIEAHWQDIVHQGEVIKLKRWLDTLNPQHIKKSAPLSMAYCWIYVFTGANHLIPNHIKDIRERLPNGARLEDECQPMKLAVIPSLVETMEATVALDRKQACKAKEHAMKAISLIPNRSNPVVKNLLQGAACYRLALAHRELGEYEQASAILMEGLAMLRASHNYFGMAITLLPIVSMYQESGKTRDAIKLCESTLNFFEEHNLQKTAPAGIVNVALARIQVDSGAFEAANKNLELGRELVKQINSPHIFSLVTATEDKLNKGVPFQPLIEPLSSRELEVLQMIANGLTNREICERLFLAMDTVKGHNRNIYGKLDVKNRTQAINKANSLKILSPQ